MPRSTKGVPRWSNMPGHPSGMWYNHCRYRTETPKRPAVVGLKSINLKLQDAFRSLMSSCSTEMDRGPAVGGTLQAQLGIVGTMASRLAGAGTCCVRGSDGLGWAHPPPKPSCGAATASSDTPRWRRSSQPLSGQTGLQSGSHTTPPSPNPIPPRPCLPPVPRKSNLRWAPAAQRSF